MRYLALACDYDGTVASEGRVAEETCAALERLVASGRKLLLVTGRELEDLLPIFPRVDLCEWVVAENGAVLYRPATREITLLGNPPPAEFIHTLHARGIAPLATGRAIVATREPHENAVLDVIRDLGLELQVIFNKGAVMVLPTGINKATGLKAALREMGLSPHNVVGVGDAENDHAFLALCECAVTVAGALRLVKARADMITHGDNGAGVVELIDALVADDLRTYESQLTRHHILLGRQESGAEVRVSPYGINLLLAGPSGSGKSTLATGFLERLDEPGYQFCIIDPEGDYENVAGAIILGDAKRPPSITEVLQLLSDPTQNAVVNLLGLALEDRPTFFAPLLSRLQELRLQAGRPHWVVVDEAQQRIIVSDTGNHRLQIFDLQGKFISFLGKNGNREKEFLFPTFLAQDSLGRTYVVDTINQRIQIFDKDLNFAGKFGDAGDILGYFGRPKGIAVDAAGNIFVSDSYFNVISIFDKERKPLLFFGRNDSGKGNLYVPMGLAINSQGEVIVADSQNLRAAVFKVTW